MGGVIWVVVAFLLVATTKYFTSLRLRGLQEKMQREQQNATDMKIALDQVSEREGKLREDLEKAQARLTTMRNVVANLERTLQKHVAAP
jgi:predicted  nucleic acid-binding Zn-ribbon protein